MDIFFGAKLPTMSVVATVLDRTSGERFDIDEAEIETYLTSGKLGSAVEYTTNNDGDILFDIPEGLDNGVYGIKIVITKEGEGLTADRYVCGMPDMFAVTYDEREATRNEASITFKFSGYAYAANTELTDMSSMDDSSSTSSVTVDIDAALKKKQDKLTAGKAIEITDDNIINVVTSQLGITGVYTYKGSKENFQAIKSYCAENGASVGDVYNAEDTGNNYAVTAVTGGQTVVRFTLIGYGEVSLIVGDTIDLNVDGTTRSCICTTIADTDDNVYGVLYFKENDIEYIVAPNGASGYSSISLEGLGDSILYMTKEQLESGTIVDGDYIYSSNVETGHYSIDWDALGGTFEFTEDKFDCSSAYTVGGLDIDTDLTDKTAYEVLDMIVNAEFAPKWTDASASIKIDSATSKTYSVGDTIPTLDSFTLGGSTAKAVGKTTATGGAAIAVDNTDSTKSSVSLSSGNFGDTINSRSSITVTYVRKYAAGTSVVVSSKGNPTNKTYTGDTKVKLTNASANSNIDASTYKINTISKTADEVTIYYVYPYFASTSTAGVETQQSLTTSKTLTFTVKGGDAGQVFSIFGTASKIEEKNAFGQYDDATSGWTATDESKEINGLKRTYKKYTKNISAGSNFEVRVTFTPTTEN